MYVCECCCAWSPESSDIPGVVVTVGCAPSDVLETPWVQHQNMLLIIEQSLQPQESIIFGINLSFNRPMLQGQCPQNILTLFLSVYEKKSEEVEVESNASCEGSKGLYTSSLLEVDLHLLWRNLLISPYQIHKEILFACHRKIEWVYGGRTHEGVGGTQKVILKDILLHTGSH